VGLTPVLLGFGVAILWLVTAGEPKPFPVELQTTTIGTVLWLGIRCLGSVVIAPICEELAFRGFLLRRLQSKIFEAVPFHQFGILPLIVSSVLFGALHGDRWLAATLAGAAYALVMRHRGRLSDAVLAHASTNGVIAIYSLWLQDWQHWAA
jgi:CAAX prenyl protease-like protein